MWLTFLFSSSFISTSITCKDEVKKWPLLVMLLLLLLVESVQDWYHWKEKEWCHSPCRWSSHYALFTLWTTQTEDTQDDKSVWRRMTLPFLGIQVRNESWIYGLPKSSFILVFREQKLNEDSSDQQRAFRVLSLEESLASMHQSPPLRLDFPKSLIGICRLCNDRKNAQMTDKTNTKNIPTRITLRDDQHPGWGTFLQSLLRQPLIMLRFLYQSLFLEMKVLRSSKWM